MKSLYAPIFGLMLTVLTTQAQAFDIEWDKCAYLKNERYGYSSREYKECRAQYGYDQNTAQAKSENIYSCRDNGKIEMYEVEIKQDGGKVYFRNASSPNWFAADETVEVLLSASRVSINSKADQSVMSICLKK